MVGMSLGTGVDSQTRRQRGARPDQPPRPVPVAMIAAPRLIGAAIIGATLEVDPGHWSGVPAPELTLIWQRDGVDLPGATATTLALGADLDGARLRCLVTARGGQGSASGFSDELSVAYSAPRARGTLDAPVLIQNSGDHILNAFPDFTGQSLTFSVTGDGVTIDPTTGLLTIRTDALLSGVSVVVTASNSGGAATSAFRLTVGAAPVTPELPVEVAPVLLRAPRLIGPAVVGALVTLDEGDWSVGAEALSFAWQRDGVDIAGATGDAYQPVAGDDRTALRAVVTARNAVGTLVAVTEPVSVAHPAPVASGVLADVTVDLDSGVTRIETARAFTGAGLVFQVAGGGAVIDPSSGVLSLATDAERMGESVTVIARNSGGEAAIAFAFTVRAVAPALVTAPSLTGTGVIGAQVTLSPGVWSGEPTPVTSFQWRRGGVDLSGATGAVYVPVAQDDLTDLSCVVTARNGAGSVSATAGPLRITRAAPVAAGRLAAQSLVQGTGVKTVAAAADFTGAGLSFSVTGAGAVIDAVTGVVSLSTDTPRAATVIVVTARNSGGVATSSFTLSIAAAAVVAPAALVAGDWDVYHDYDPTAGYTDKITWHIRVLKSGLTPTRIAYRGDEDVLASHTAGAGFHLCIPHPTKANVWVVRADIGAVIKPWIWCNSELAQYNCMGQTKSNRIIYTLDPVASVEAAAANWSASSNQIRKVVALEAPAVVEPAYIRAPMYSAAAAAIQAQPGDAEQISVCMARSRTDPQRIYMGGDMHGFWVSSTGGSSWETVRNRGLGTVFIWGAEVDPLDKNIVIVYAGNPYLNGRYRPASGFYRTVDGGLTWTKVMTYLDGAMPGKATHRFAWALSTALAPGATSASVRWYAAFDSQNRNSTVAYQRQPGLFTSVGGVDWTRVGDLPLDTFGDDILGVTVHPTVASRIFIWSSGGLFRIDDAHLGDGVTVAGKGSYTKISGQSGSGKLPAGKIYAEPYISANGATMIVAVERKGVYKSTDGGSSWSQLLSHPQITHCAVNPGFPEMIYTYTQNGSNSYWDTATEVRGTPRASKNGGIDWYKPTYAQYTPPVGSGALIMMPGGVMPFISPDPSNKLVAVGMAHAQMFRTEDGGVTWRGTNNGFCGVQHDQYAAPHSFHKTDPKTYLLGLVDRSILVTTNGGVTNTNMAESLRAAFTAADVETSGSISINGLALHADGQTILCGARGQSSTTAVVLCRSPDFGATWTVVRPTEGRRQWVGWDAGDPNYAYQFNERSTNKGLTWSTMSALPAESYVVGVSTATISRTVSGATVANSVVYAVDFGSSGLAYGTKKKIYKSIDKGASWTLVFDCPYVLTYDGLPGGLFRIHPTNPHVFFTEGPVVGKGSGKAGVAGVRRWDCSNMANVTWKDLVPTGVPDGFVPVNFNVDYRDPNVMYLRSNMNNTGDLLWMTTTGGGTGGNDWTNISAGFSNMNMCNGMEVHPLTGVLYLATSNGMYVRKPPYAVPTADNTYDLLRAAYPYWNYALHHETSY